MSARTGRRQRRGVAVECDRDLQLGHGLERIARAPQPVSQARDRPMKATQGCALGPYWAYTLRY